MGYKRNQTPLTPEQAVTYALRLLGQRPYSIAKITEKLRLKDVPDPEIATIITKLTSLGLLDDVRYATALARNEIEFTKKSWWWTKQKLGSKGISPEIIGLVTTQTAALPAETINIDYHITKHLKRYGNPKSYIDQQKLVGKLARKGFRPSDIVRRLKELKGLDLSDDESLLE